MINNLWSCLVTRQETLATSEAGRFYHVIYMMCDVVWCLFVCLLYCYIFPEPLNPSLSNQRLMVTEDSVFLVPEVLAKFQLVHLQQGRQIHIVYEKIMIFYHCLAIYWKR